MAEDITPETSDYEVGVTLTIKATSFEAAKVYVETWWQNLGPLQGAVSGFEVSGE